MTNLKSFNCKNCNPTVLNPEFKTKCQWCVRYSVKKQQERAEAVFGIPKKQPKGQQEAQVDAGLPDDYVVTA